MISESDVVVADVRARATDCARAVAEAAGVEVRALTEVTGLRAASALLASVWGTSDDRQPVSSEILRALSATGNYVAGAFSGTELVGATVAFLANGGPDSLAFADSLLDQGSRPAARQSVRLHSHITGLIPSRQRRGIGFALKLHQRSWALDSGLTVVSWTFDPLVRRNGYFNLTKLGAETRRFHESFYGELSDQLNGGDESDRCEVTWQLASAHVDAAASGSAIAPTLDELRAEGATVVLDERPDGSPAAHPLRGDIRLCWVPPDIGELRSRAPHTARAWRLAVRGIFGPSMADGFVATDVTRSGWYVLRRDR